MEFSKKKKILILAGAGVLLIGILVGLVIGIANRSTSVALYGLPKNITKSLDEYIQKSGGKYKVHIIEENDNLSVSQSKKYDLIFTWNGAEAENFCKIAKEIPGGIYSSMPTSVRKSGKINDKNKMMPVLIEHCPIYICKDAATFNSERGPESLYELEEDLKSEKAAFDFAMLCSGSEDEDFYDFLSMFAESLLGGEGYKKLASIILEKKELSEVLDEAVAKSSEGSDLTFRMVLDKICEWQKDGKVQNQWYMLSRDDLITLMQRQSFYIGSMPLYYYRELPRRIAYNYVAYRFPIMDSKVGHGLIAPEVVMIANSQKKSVKKLGTYLTTLEIQEQLSNITTLAPVHSQAGAYDSISDDTRFYVAASSEGPLPQLKKAAFVSDSAAQKFAQDVRSYLKMGR